MNMYRVYITTATEETILPGLLHVASVKLCVCFGPYSPSGHLGLKRELDGGIPRLVHPLG